MAIANTQTMTTPKGVHWGFLVLAVGLSLECFAACKGDAEGAATAGAGGTTGSGGSGETAGLSTTGNGDGTTGPSIPRGDGVAPIEPPYTDLFACDFGLSCPVCEHSDSGVCQDSKAATCAVRLWVDESGVLMVKSDRWETLLLLSGEGGGVTQTRSRSCPDGKSECNLEDIPWTLDPQERCIFDSIFPRAELCRPTNESCDDVREMLEDAGGVGGGRAGDGGGAGETAE